ncbi:peptidoglycan-binding protein [Streptomyces sp. H27-D2]|uniref:peptidoglycan-binding protein n=1 Tax=Streptomyces sp. H27-D2 TaxID=3046304 RepID=UPI002DBC07B3|nr:peptidoglycan-binding protein [Streptomyces sp. H27-D2]MEC4016398.1 peptidoglycan-binding protein [Streptomyces sp. H27-D2]
MATPLSADAFVRALRAEGVQVVEHDNWRTHNRNHKGPWGPVGGVMLHHTAGTSSVDFCRAGYTELPGPLCIGVLTKHGRVHLIGYGRTNHAGNGSQAVYHAVLAESALPASPGPDAIDGNARFYGFEIENTGDAGDPYPSAQLDAAERVSAAICRAHGWGSGSVIGHKEWTRRKPDPSFSMPGMRSRIAQRLGTRPQPQPGYEPFPGAAFFAAGRRSGLVTAVGKRLAAEGCGRYTQGPGPVWTQADQTSYAAWQRKLGYRGDDADGIPGQASWDKLRVPRA